MKNELEILKMGDAILTELKKNPNHITKQLSKDEETSYNTGFHMGFNLGYVQLPDDDARANYYEDKIDMLRRISEKKDEEIYSLEKQIQELNKTK